MRANSFQLIKFCGTQTVPAAKTKSIGLQADARVVMVFAFPSGQFYYNMTNPARLSGPRHLDNFIVTRNLHPSTGTLPTFVKTSAFKAKTHANPDTPRHRSGQAHGNSLNRRAIISHRYRDT